MMLHASRALHARDRARRKRAIAGVCGSLLAVEMAWAFSQPDSPRTVDTPSAHTHRDGGTSTPAAETQGKNAQSDKGPSEKPKSVEASPASTPEASLPTPAAAIGMTYSAYRSKAIAERVRVRVVTASGAETRSGLVVRTRPADGTSPPEAVIEAGSLIIHAQGAKLTAVHQAFPLTYWQGSIEGDDGAASGLAAFTSALGPLPLPQLALVFGKRAEQLASPVPQASGVVWAGVRRVKVASTQPVNQPDAASGGEPPIQGSGPAPEPGVNPPTSEPTPTGEVAQLSGEPLTVDRLVVHGQSPLGACELTIDEATGRIVGLRVPVTASGDRLELVIADEPDGPLPSRATPSTVTTSAPPPAPTSPTSGPTSAPTPGVEAAGSGTGNGAGHRAVMEFRLDGPWSLDLKGRVRVAALSLLGARVGPGEVTDEGPPGGRGAATPGR